MKSNLTDEEKKFITKTIPEKLEVLRDIQETMFKAGMNYMEKKTIYEAQQKQADTASAAYTMALNALNVYRKKAQRLLGFFNDAL